VQLEGPFGLFAAGAFVSGFDPKFVRGALARCGSLIFVRENKIEIVHAHVARDYIPASIACMASPAKFVLTRHLVLPLKPFNRFALKNLTRAIAVSDAVAENLRNVFPREKVTTVYNGVDTRFRKIENGKKLDEEFRVFHNIPSDAPIVGTLGELKELKGQREFVLAAA
jgi:glycosyltransferase involved in cell wall biosynthesis